MAFIPLAELAAIEAGALGAPGRTLQPTAIRPIWPGEVD